MQLTEDEFKLTKKRQREFFCIHYAAGSWKRTRQIIAKLEATEKGRNFRFTVANMEGAS